MKVKNFRRNRMAEEKYKGTVVWYSSQRGFGFIRGDNEDADLFVQHSHILMDGFRKLEADQRVEFEIGKNDKGELATNVKVI